MKRISKRHPKWILPTSLISDITSDVTKDDWEQGQDEQQATVSPPTDKTNNKIENKENILANLHVYVEQQRKFTQEETYMYMSIMSGIRFIVTLELHVTYCKILSLIHKRTCTIYSPACMMVHVSTDQLQLPHDFSLLQLQANGISDNIAVIAI